VIIVNPVNTDVARLRTAVAGEEERSGWLPSVWFETTEHDAGQAVAGTALTHDPSLVIVAGGDGTIRAVVEGIRSQAIPVAVVPRGTGNLLARNLGLMASIEQAVHTAFAGQERPIDVGHVELTGDDGRTTTHLFLAMTGIGLDAQMATDTHPGLKKRIGWLAYAQPISRSVVKNAQFEMRYRIDGQRERSVRAHTVIVGNCGTLTAGLVLLPDAEPDDGLLDVVVLRPKGFWQWVRVGSRLGIGAILHRSRRGRVILAAAPGLRALQYVQARALTARFEQPQTIEIDGDSFGDVVGVTVTLAPQPVSVRVPRV